MAGEWLNALMQMPNAGASFAQGFEQARKSRIAEQQLAEERRWKMEDRSREREKFALDKQKAALEQYKDKIEIGAKIIAAINPTDDASWQRAREVAKSYGVDVDALGVPQHYEKPYVDGLVALSGQKEAQGRIITPQPGAGAWQLNPDGTMKELIRPNDGSVAVGAPVNAPKPLTDEEMRALEGGQGQAGPGGFR